MSSAESSSDAERSRRRRERCYGFQGRGRPTARAQGVNSRKKAGVEVVEQHHDLEQVRALLGHARIDTTQIYTSIRPPQLKRAVSLCEERAVRMRGERDGTRTTISVTNGDKHASQ
jgi:hypothetical protein